MPETIKRITLPTRPQPDTIVAIFLLKQFGESVFPGVNDATVITEPNPQVSDGSLLLDVGGGELDHHGTDLCASEIVAKKLNVLQDKALRKMLAYARRDDTQGKGIISKDPIDRAFGLSGLIANLNKQNPKDPNIVVQTVLPLLTTHFTDADEHYNKLPKLVDDLAKTNLFRSVTIKNPEIGIIKAAFVTSDHIGLAGYLRSDFGGNYRVIIQRRPSGHVNVITKQNPKLDLSHLAAMVRMQECVERDIEVTDESSFYTTGTHELAPNWYYDPATNSLLNGGVTPDSIEPTKLNWEDTQTIVEHCLKIIAPA